MNVKIDTYTGMVTMCWPFQRHYTGRFDVKSGLARAIKFSVHGIKELVDIHLQIKRSSAGIAQLVEHNLAKVGVASSSLVSRSRLSGPG